MVISRKLKIFKKITIILLIIYFLFDITAYCFPTFIPSLLRFYYRSPVNFEKIEVNFPKGFIYNKDKNSIGLSLWDNAFPNLIFLKLSNLKNKSKENYLNFIKNNHLKIVRVEDSKFRNYNSTVVYYLDNNWRFSRSICVYDLNLIIIYTGPKSDLQAFDEIIESIILVGEK